MPGRSDEDRLWAGRGVTKTWPGNLTGPSGVQSIIGFPKPTVEGPSCPKASELYIGLLWSVRHLKVTASRCPPSQTKGAVSFGLRIGLWRMVAPRLGVGVESLSEQGKHAR